VNQFEIWINGHHYFEEHRQKIFEIEQWAQMIGKSRFKLLHIFSNFSLNPAHDRSERAHFVLLKESP
jgi:AraC-like DNA-binding protein